MTSPMRCESLEMRQMIVKNHVLNMLRMMQERVRLDELGSSEKREEKYVKLYWKTHRNAKACYDI